MNKNDLHKIAPLLSKIALNKTPFEAPKKYFDTVEDAVLAKIMAETIQSNKSKNTFKTPDNYFDSIENIVIAKLKAESLHNNDSNTIPESYFDSIEDNVLNKLNRNPKGNFIKVRFLKYVAPLAIAASLLLIFILNNNTKSVSFDSLTFTEIEYWINEGSIDIDEYNISALYAEVEINNDINSTLLSDDEVLDYLYEEDLDEIIYDN